MPEDRVKRPAYQWYVSDARNDEVFMLMSYEQQGVYRHLLDHQWIEGSIPAEVERIAALCPKVPANRFAEIWRLISCKFQPHGADRLINAKLEAQRRELDDWLQEQHRRGSVGGRRRADRLAAARAGLVAEGVANVKPDGSSSSSTTSSSTSTSTEEHGGSSAASAELVVLEFPTVGVHGSSWGLTQTQVADWQAAFPSIDILAEAKKALAWLHANPGRRKTVAGMPKFLVGWLSRTNDRGRSAPAAAPISPAGSATQAAAERVKARLRGQG